MANSIPKNPKSAKNKLAVFFRLEKKIVPPAYRVPEYIGRFIAGLETTSSYEPGDKLASLTEEKQR